jgi:hypothetical protein
MLYYQYEAYYKFYTGQLEKADDSGIPANATTRRPPLERCDSGQIPVFRDGDWVIVEDHFWRPTFVEINYDAGRPLSSYETVDIGLLRRDRFPQYPVLPMICNSLLATVTISQKVKFVQKKFAYLTNLHSQIASMAIFEAIDSPREHELDVKPNIVYEYAFEVQSLVLNIRQCLDYLVQLTCVLVDFPNYEKTRRLRFDSIGSLLGKKGTGTIERSIVEGDGKDFGRDHTRFLEIANELFNSFKHCLMSVETHSSFGVPYPTVTSYFALNNDYNSVIHYHNHNLYHFVMGFQDCVLRVLDNQRRWLSRRAT